MRHRVRCAAASTALQQELSSYLWPKALFSLFKRNRYRHSCKFSADMSANWCSIGPFERRYSGQTKSWKHQGTECGREAYIGPLPIPGIDIESSVDATMAMTGYTQHINNVKHTPAKASIRQTTKDLVTRRRVPRCFSTSAYCAFSGSQGPAGMGPASAGMLACAWRGACSGYGADLVGFPVSTLEASDDKAITECSTSG